MKTKYHIFSSPEISTKDVVLVREDVVENGRVVSRLVEKTIDRRESVEGLKVEDYALENQISVGSLSLKNSFTLGADSLDHVTDQINAATDALEAAVAAKNDD